MRANACAQRKMIACRLHGGYRCERDGRGNRGWEQEMYGGCRCGEGSLNRVCQLPARAEHRFLNVIGQAVGHGGRCPKSWGDNDAM